MNCLLKCIHLLFKNNIIIVKAHFHHCDEKKYPLSHYNEKKFIEIMTVSQNNDLSRNNYLAFQNNEKPSQHNNLIFQNNDLVSYEKH